LLMFRYIGRARNLRACLPRRVNTSAFKLKGRTKTARTRKYELMSYAGGFYMT
jgi:hypothetical protein